ncbi:ABC transporter permease [Puia dinghuensis]|uniref:ABC transporter permease n=1 Tax=Puia dinghuensis TaxID=1792502 RepID=A0A8J2UH63_9BACT|nr:ABC transporter permease [Puia dinghuensis]GGB17278.1 ABC transporter permease [Puia dinghuensis]
MFKNYLKVAFRNLWKNKGFSFINITGLAVGMASAILILLWIHNEVSYDGFHEKRDRIYEAWNRAEFSGEMHCWNTTPRVLASALQRDLPEVEHACRVDWANHRLFSVGDKRIMSLGNVVDSIFLQVFSFPLVEGNPATALMDFHGVVITQSLARTLFGREEAMGKVVRIDDKENFTVTGVLKDLPHNTRFDFEYLLPWSYNRRLFGDDVNWGNNSTRTYVLLKSNATLASAAPKVKVMKTRYDSSEKHWEMFLYPISRWRLYSSFKGTVEDGGLIVFVRLFGVIAGFILLIACINFMNLSTARSERRAKEVGIRKVVGAPRSRLISQFIGESVLLSFLAALVAIGIVLLSLPGFNTLTGAQLYIPFGNPWFWLSGLVFILFTGLLAGSYPAFFLSSFQPVKVLKGTFRAANALVTPRKVLVVLQFTFAITLIICTIIVTQQINYARDREVGYNRANLIFHFMEGDIYKNYALIKQELLSSGVALSVCKTSAPLTDSWSDTWGFGWTGKDPNDKTDFNRVVTDEGLVTTTGMRLIQGRDLDLRQYPTDSNAILLNESAVKAMHFKDPIGQIITDDTIHFHVVGVVKDYIMESPYSPIRPLVILGARETWFSVINMRLNPARLTADNLRMAEAIFKKYNRQYPFEHHFVDEDYSKKFDEEKRIGTLAGLFAVLTIFISCLGLFGLATYMAENRVKEIGVRKVLGASVAGITALLSKDFLMLVLVSFVVAAPIAWYAMYKWLQDYSYRVKIEWWVFALAAVLSMAIALLTVSYQAIRAGLANPARSLRSE